MPRYSLTGHGQKVEITAQAPGHRFVVEGTELRGFFRLEGERLMEAELELALVSLTAHDRLKDHELRRFLDIPRSASAEARLIEPAKLSLRGTELEGRARFRCSIGPRKAETWVTLSGRPEAGEARFALSFSGLGYKPPRLLLFSVKDELEIAVWTRAEETATPAV